MNWENVGIYSRSAEFIYVLCPPTANGKIHKIADEAPLHRTLNTICPKAEGLDSATNS